MGLAGAVQVTLKIRSGSEAHPVRFLVAPLVRNDPKLVVSCKWFYYREVMGKAVSTKSPVKYSASGARIRQSHKPEMCLAVKPRRALVVLIGGNAKGVKPQVDLWGYLVVAQTRARIHP